MAGESVRLLGRLAGNGQSRTADSRHAPARSWRVDPAGISDLGSRRAVRVPPTMKGPHSSTMGLRDHREVTEQSLSAVIVPQI
jgi:hypothetical protein